MIFFPQQPDPLRIRRIVNRGQSTLSNFLKRDTVGRPPIYPDLPETIRTLFEQLQWKTHLLPNRIDKIFVHL